ncbi:MAG: FtsQ-type POTRA domain-containing protein [Candidatus Korobacteraceae bacterium]|jgi:cell division protein FtsQ
MVRKNSSAISEDELEEAASESARRMRHDDESPLDARMFDLDDEAESPFLRGQKRVPVRRGALPRKAASRVKILLILLCVGAGVALLWIALQRYGTQSWRFRLDSSDDIAISGSNHVNSSQVRNVMASDIDRNIFFVPLGERKKQLEQIPWVQSASVMRLLPNRLNIVITERTPVAFVETGSHIALIDANGVIMELSAGQTTKYSFPVVVGISDSDPLSTRAARMRIYSQLMKELDSSGGHYSADISDVDLSDPYDVKATVTDPQGAVLVHLGTANFLEHFKVYVAHVQEWRAQFHKLESVDLRYDHQVIVNPDSAGVEAAQNSPNAAPNAEAGAGQATPEHKKVVPGARKKH